MAKDSLRFLDQSNLKPTCNCDILDKENSAYNYIQYMLDRTNRIFRYTNLPPTIPAYLLETMLQVYGSVAIISHNGSLYAICCNFGGPPDPYYRPTQAVIANPALDITDIYRIVNNLPPFDSTLWSSMPSCVRMLNDTQIHGLLPLFSRYAYQMAENDISIRSAQINLRQQSVIVADTGPEIQSAETYISNLEAGKLASIQKRPFAEGINIIPVQTSGGNIVTQLIELQQYLKASWYNEMGLNSNFNMKREYVSQDELNTTTDIFLPMIDNMFQCRKDAIEAINKEFGTEISVEKDSSWELKEKELNPNDLSSPETDSQSLVNSTDTSNPKSTKSDEDTGGDEDADEQQDAPD